MKKLLLTVLLFAIAFNVFAQLTFRAGVDTVFIPFQFIQRPDGVNLMGMGMCRYDSNNQNARARITAQLNLEYVGFMMQLQFMANRVSDYEDEEPAASYFGLGENAYAYWQPNSYLRFDAGKFMQDDLRGKINANWTQKFTVGTYNGDEIFSRFKGRGFVNAYGATFRSDFGFLTTVKYNDFAAYVLFPGLFPMSTTNGNWFKPYSTSGTAWIDGYPQDHGVLEVVDSSGNNDFIRTLERVQVAFSYKIPTKALFRVQYLGGNVTGFQGAVPDFNNPSYMIDDNLPSNNVSRVEAAANITMIKNLNLDIGAKYHLPWLAANVKTWDSSQGKWTKQNVNAPGRLQKAMQISLGAQYTGINKYNLIGRVDAKFAGTYDHENGSPLINLPFELNFHAWPTYRFDFMTLGLDLALEYIGEKTAANVVQIESGMRLGGGVFAEKRWGQCILRGGVFFRAPMEIGGTKEDMVLTIPFIFDLYL